MHYQTPRCNLLLTDWLWFCRKVPRLQHGCCFRTLYAFDILSPSLFTEHCSIKLHPQPWCPNRTDQLQTILALRGWQRLSGAQQVTERKSLLFECLYICASLPESVLAGSIKHYVGAQLSVLYNKGHSRHSVTEEVS